MKRVAGWIAVMALALAGSACSSRAGATGILRAAAVGRGAQFRLNNAAWKTLEGDTALPAKAEVRSGAGRVELSDGGNRFSLGPSTWIAVRSAEDLVVKTGSVLAESRRGMLTLSDGGDRTVTGDEGAAFRFDYGMRIVSYRGWCHTTVTGERHNIYAGHEITVGLTSQIPHLLIIDRLDPWEKRLLADAIEIDDRLAPYRASFDANTGGGPATPTFLSSYAPHPQIAFLDPLLAGRLVGEKKLDVLVLLFIALEHARTDGLSPQKSFAQALRLHDQGATLGLVAYVLNVPAKQILHDVVLALSPHAPGSIVPTTPAQPTATQPSQPTPTSSSSTPPATTTATPTPSNHPTPTATPTSSPPASPSPSPSPSPSCSVVDHLTNKC
ncbi:MAG: hypothetical protein NVSMB57_15500 [Actinomycetota bacterium]